MEINPKRLEARKRGWADPYTGEIYEYGRNLDLQGGYAIKGHFDVDRSKYLIEPFRAIKNNKIRTVVIVKAVQTGGSLLADISVPYWIRHDPGDVLWLLQDDRFVGTYMGARFIPLLKRIPEVATLLARQGRFGLKKDEILLPQMTVMMGGLNEGNVQSFSWQRVIIDEAWMAQSNGLIRQAKDRATAYPATCKILIISQAGTEGDDLDLEWKGSNMREWHWQCPSCSKHQPFEWSAKRSDGSWAGMKWSTNEFTRPGGRWNYVEVAKTARLECIHCGHQLEDTPANRRRLDDTHKFEPQQPNADPTIAGFHWPAVANADISFASLVTKYLKAKEQQEDHGYILPLVEFYQKQLAQPWNVNTAADYHRVSYEPYEPSKDWPDEMLRVLTVDCQKDFREFWYVVRAWAKSGESRQLARGRAESWDEIAKIQADWKVADQRVFVDVGYEQTRAAQECVKHGHLGQMGPHRVWFCWTALKGVRQETFTHENSKTHTSEKRIYSKQDMLDPYIGTGNRGQLCPFYSWSNLHVKDILRRHRDGQAAKFLSLPDTAPGTDIWSYTSQLNAELRIKERNEDGKMISIWKPIGRRPNHYWDCEAMQVAVACIAGIIGDAAPSALTEPPIVKG